jgi:hypothetical protein
MGADAKEVIQAVEVDPLNRNRDISGEIDIEVMPSLFSSVLLLIWFRHGRNSHSKEGNPR